MKYKKNILILTFSLLVKSSFSQIEKTIDSLTKVEQACLDSGVRLPNCSYIFLEQIDSLLNVVYKKIRTSIDSVQKVELKKDELIWLKKRDKYFKEVDKKYIAKINSGEWGRDMRMITYEEKSSFINDRIVVLLRVYNKIKFN